MSTKPDETLDLSYSVSFVVPQLANSPVRKPLMCREMAWRHRHDAIPRSQVLNVSSDAGYDASALARARRILGVDLSA